MPSLLTGRIAFFVGDISRGGGTERVTRDIANALSARGWQVSIVSMSAGLCSTFSLDSDVKLFSLKCENLSATFGVNAARRRLRALAEQLQVDWWVDVDTVLSIYSIPALKGLRTHVISWEHFNLLANPGDLVQKWRRLKGRFLASRGAKALIVLSDRDLSQYRRWLNPRCRLLRIYNPCSSSIRLSLSDTAKRRDSRTVLAVGRLERQKGFDLLLRAWAEVHHQCPDWTLRIVGSGTQEPILKDLIISLSLESSVQLTPFSRQIEKHYRESSVFVCSSRFEGFGLVLAEAKAVGLPVVSFDCRCGPSEIVRHNYDGLLVKAGKSEQLATALRALIRDEQKRVLFSRRASADHRFNGEQILNAWEDLLASTGSTPLYASSAVC